MTSQMRLLLQFGKEIRKWCERNDILGSMACVYFAPPISPGQEIRSPLSRELKEKLSQPRLNLRFLANYRNMMTLAICYLLVHFAFGYGPVGFLFVVLLFTLVVGFFKALLKPRALKLKPHWCVWRAFRWTSCGTITVLQWNCTAVILVYSYSPTVSVSVRQQHVLGLSSMGDNHQLMSLWNRQLSFLSTYIVRKQHLFRDCQVWGTITNWYHNKLYSCHSCLLLTPYSFCICQTTTPV